MKKKYIIFIIILIVILVSALPMYSLLSKSKTTFDNYINSSTKDTPDLSTDLTLEEIEKEWMEYERNRPSINDVDKYEWSLIINNISCDIESDDLFNIVVDYIDSSSNYTVFNEGFKYDFITNEITNTQGFISWGDTNVYYVLNDIGTLYIRVYNADK